jgi:hypothetical protein
MELMQRSASGFLLMQLPLTAESSPHQLQMSEDYRRITLQANTEHDDK